MAKSICALSVHVPQDAVKDPNKFTEWLHNYCVKVFDGGRGGLATSGLGGQRTFQFKRIGVVTARDSEELEGKLSQRIPADLSAIPAAA
jgi:hypothetical protein